MPNVSAAFDNARAAFDNDPTTANDAVAILERAVTTADRARAAAKRAVYHAEFARGRAARAAAAASVAADHAVAAARIAANRATAAIASLTPLPRRNLKATALKHFKNETTVQQDNSKSEPLSTAVTTYASTPTTSIATEGNQTNDTIK